MYLFETAPVRNSGFAIVCPVYELGLQMNYIVPW